MKKRIVELCVQQSHPSSWKFIPSVPKTIPASSPTYLPRPKDWYMLLTRCFLPSIKISPPLFYRKQVPHTHFIFFLHSIRKEFFFFCIFLLFIYFPIFIFFFFVFFTLCELWKESRKEKQPLDMQSNRFENLQGRICKAGIYIPLGFYRKKKLYVCWRHHAIYIYVCTLCGLMVDRGQETTMNLRSSVGVTWCKSFFFFLLKLITRNISMDLNFQTDKVPDLCLKLDEDNLKKVKTRS